MKKAEFRNAHFTGEADFTGVQFTGEANFTGVQFTERAHFMDAQFTERAHFLDAEFTGADFTGVQFTGEANFVFAQFTEMTYFTAARFQEIAYLDRTNIKEAHFYKTRFAEADFSNIENRNREKESAEKAYPHLNFQNVQFDNQEHTIFLSDDLSEVSFINTDITRVRFGEDVVWGDKFKIREEREIENQLKTKSVAIDIQLGDVLAVYRNLRENYEFRMRYDEAGEFFIREMEMNRLYREETKNGETQIKRNNWVTRNLSLTGLYYHLSKYGQSFSRPVLFGIGIVIFSTFLWLTQPNPATDFSIHNMTIPHIVTIPILDNKTNIEIAFERGLTNFLPSLSFGTELNVGLLDVAFKIVGGAVTFGLIIIALRRKFERKFRH